MQDKTARILAELILLGMAVQLLVTAYVFESSYNARKTLVVIQREDCERTKLDRAASAEGWRIAQDRSTSQHQPNFALRYSRLAGGFEARANIPCEELYPKAKVFP